MTILELPKRLESLTKIPGNVSDMVDVEYVIEVQI
jgi:hypothetical protein